MYKIVSSRPRAQKPPPIRTDEEAIAWLRKFRSAPEFRDEDGHPMVPIARFCDFAGVSRVSVYRFIQGYRVGERFKSRLLVAIEAVRSGLRWRRQADHRYVVTDPEKFRHFPRYDLPIKSREGDAA